MDIFEARESQILQYLASKTSSTTVVLSVPANFPRVSGNQHDSVEVVSSRSGSEMGIY